MNIKGKWSKTEEKMEMTHKLTTNMESEANEV